MKRVAVLAAAVIVAAACSDSSPVAPDTDVETAMRSARDPEVVRVRNGNDAGPGSFRAAIEAANANDDDIRRVEFDDRVSSIRLQHPVEFTSSQSLAIDANHATLDGSELADGSTAFVASGGGDLSIRSMTVKDAPDNGISIRVPIRIGRHEEVLAR